MVEALSGDIMLPALPDIGEAFAVANPNDRSLVLMTFGLGFGLAQPFFGPLSDRFGRRPPILGACSFTSSVRSRRSWRPTSARSSPSASSRAAPRRP
jgi:MFS family permease